MFRSLTPYSLFITEIMPTDRTSATHILQLFHVIAQCRL